MDRTTSVDPSVSRGRMRTPIRRAYRAALLGSIVGLLLLPVSHAVDGGPHPNDVSMVELIANPDRYKNQEVRLYAFGVFQFEESSLYLSRMHAELMDAANEIPLLDDEDHSRLNGEIVRVEAVFRVDEARPRGYLDSTKRIVAATKPRTFDARDSRP